MSDRPKQVEKSTRQYCPSCYAESPQGVQFCTKCGAHLLCGAHNGNGSHAGGYTTAVATPPPASLTATTRVLNPLTPVVHAKPGASGPAQPPPPPHKPGRRRLVRRLISLFVLWVVVGVLLFWGRPTQDLSPVVVRATPTPEAAPTATPEAAPTSTPEVRQTPAPGIKSGSREPVELEDENGNKIGNAEIRLIDDAFVWVQGKDDEIQNIGNIVGLGRNLFDESLAKDIAESPEVVIIATADQLGGRGREEGRTDTRGLALEREVATVKGNSRDVSYVPLGQWLQTLNPRCKQVGVNAQRRIVLIRVLSRDESHPLGPALRRAIMKQLNKHDVYKDIAFCYSRSEEFPLR